MNSRQSQRGSVLLLAMVFLVVMMVVGASVISSSVTQLRVAVNTEELMKLFHSTNAAVSRAFDQTMVRTLMSEADYTQDILITHQGMNADLTEDDAIGLTEKEYGADLSLHLDRRTMGTPCPRTHSTGASSLTKISCDYFSVRGQAPFGDEEGVPGVSVSAWREMIYTNSATHRELDFSQ
jgi:hypothetical protein